MKVLIIGGEHLQHPIFKPEVMKGTEVKSKIENHLAISRQTKTVKQTSETYGKLHGNIVVRNFFEHFQDEAKKFGAIASIKVDEKIFDVLCTPGKELPSKITIDNLCSYSLLSRRQRRLATKKTNKIK